MIQNNNISVLPWYTSINEQNHRKSYAYGAIYPLFAPADRLLPFQIIRNTRSNSVTSVILYDKTGKQIANITTYMRETGLRVVRFQSLGYDVILYPAILPMPLNQFDGIYYLRLSDGVQTWYSEMFTVVQDVSGYLKIEWWDMENLVFDAGQIVYKNPDFKNTLYLVQSWESRIMNLKRMAKNGTGIFSRKNKYQSKRLNVRYWHRNFFATLCVLSVWQITFI